MGHQDVRTTSDFYLHLAGTDISDTHKHTSPVVNLGIFGGPRRPARPEIRGDIKREYAPGPGTELTPVIYSKVKKAGKRKTKKRQKIDDFSFSGHLAALFAVVKSPQHIFWLHHASLAALPVL